MKNFNLHKNHAIKQNESVNRNLQVRYRYDK